MAEIIDLRELLPEDIELVFTNETYYIPGDIDNDNAWAMYEVMLDLGWILSDSIDKPQNGSSRKTLQSTKNDLHRTKQLLDRMQKIIFDLLKQRHPEIQVMPVALNGQKAMQIVASTVLRQIGFFQEEEESEGDGEEDPTPAGKTGRSVSSTTGSGRSSKSSDSRRPRGVA